MTGAMDTAMVALLPIIQLPRITRRHARVPGSLQDPITGRFIMASAMAIVPITIVAGNAF